MRNSLPLAVVVVVVSGVALLHGDDGDRLLTIDHFLRVKSTVPAIAGQMAQLYVRERVVAGSALRNAISPDRVVLFVHGAGTPAEVLDPALLERIYGVPMDRIDRGPGRSPAVLPRV